LIVSHAEAVVEAEIGVEPPAQSLVVGVGPVGVGDWNDDGLELQVDGGSARTLGGTGIEFGRAHGSSSVTVTRQRVAVALSV
jgi:hypothetical protein